MYNQVQWFRVERVEQVAVNHCNSYPDPSTVQLLDKTLQILNKMT